MPTLKEMMSNLSETVRDVLINAKASGVIKGSPETVQKRLDICTACERFEYEPYRKCTVCGCAVTIKVHFAAAKCPIGKWEPVSESVRNPTEIKSS